MKFRDARLPERFWSKCAPDPSTGCWIWSAAKSADGYGRFSFDGGQLAHRFSFLLANGAVPGGRELDHLCRTRHCVNPAHLEAVTKLVNVRRGVSGAVAIERAKTITHCPSGHPYSGSNLLLRRNGYRLCRECKRFWDSRRSKKPKYAPPAAWEGEMP